MTGGVRGLGRTLLAGAGGRALWGAMVGTHVVRAELPANVTVVLAADGRRIDVDTNNPGMHWGGVPATGLLRVEFNNERWVFMGSDFWTYAEGVNAIVFGVRKPPQDEDTPNFVPETFTEIVFDRRFNVRPLVRYPMAIPLQAATSLRRWSR